VTELIRAIEQGGDVNVKSGGYHDTALHKAVASAHVAAALALLDYTADPNVSNKFGTSPLLLASNRGYCDLVASLVARRANVNHANNENETALHFASAQGHATVCELLLRSNADVSLCNVCTANL
jgi:uncharacterized protein